jgi:hypothetical protein
MTVVQPLGLGDYPIPPGRGRWRLLVASRSFSQTAWAPRVVADLPDATNRKLVQAWNTAAQLSFDIDGHSDACTLINELSTEIIALRWDDTSGVDVPMFRGVVDHSQDTLDGTSHTISFVAHDYLAMFGRRIVGQTITQQTGRDGLVDMLKSWGSDAAVTVGNVALTPGSNMPLARWNANPDQTQRAYDMTGPYTRTWLAGTNILQAIGDLAASTVFDFDVAPAVGGSNAGDVLRTFIPQQGVTRTDSVLNYGGTVATVQRQVDSGQYANYWYVQGNGTWGDTKNNAATGTTVGTWTSQSNAADVTAQGTCAQQAAGQLNIYGVLIPSYTLTLTPGFWYWTRVSDFVYNGFANMGDTLTLLINSGRLAVNTQVRVLGIEYDMDTSDGHEDVVLTVGRPRTELVSMLTAWQASVNALSRR